MREKGQGLGANVGLLHGYPESFNLAKEHGKCVFSQKKVLKLLTGRGGVFYHGGFCHLLS